jgi:hypothetical protein
VVDVYGEGALLPVREVRGRVQHGSSSSSSIACIALPCLSTHSCMLYCQPVHTSFV